MWSMYTPYDTFARGISYEQKEKFVYLRCI